MLLRKKEIKLNFILLFCSRSNIKVCCVVLCCVAIPTLTLMEQPANNHPRNKELLYTNVTSITLNSAQFSSIKYNFIDLQRLVPGRCDLGRCRVSPAIPEQFLQRDFLLPGSTVDMGGACQLAST